MDKKFVVSEKYRKYIVMLKFQKLDLYTVWGTDLADHEKDKLIASNGKMVAFKSLQTLREELKHFPHIFQDKENFDRWILEEDFDHVYTTYDFRLLIEFDFQILKDKSNSLMLLNCLNLVQDLAYQLNNIALKVLVENPAWIGLKDHIYNNYFWKKDEDKKSDLPLEDFYVPKFLKDLYHNFLGGINFH